jgi:RNA polymerase sigma-70 factor (ECF subfamily)
MDVLSSLASMERTDEDIATACHASLASDVACSDGQLSNFDGLYQRYARPIYAFVYRRIGERAAAEDITSTIFLKALEAIRSFNPRKASFRTWLYQIARNAVIDHIRAMAPRATEDIETAWDIPGSDRTEALLEASLRDDKLRSALAALTPLQRQILFLRLWENLSYAEIAGIVGKKEDHCKVIFSRTIKELRTQLPLMTLLLFVCSPFLP